MKQKCEVRKYHVNVYFEITNTLSYFFFLSFLKLIISENSEYENANSLCRLKSLFLKDNINLRVGLYRTLIYNTGWLINDRIYKI